MVRKVVIDNYKSISHLELELGRVNVFIGENGSGKTNILEALAIAGAASQNKLDYEFLFNRGIRATNPRMMMGAFKDRPENKQIQLLISDSEEKHLGINLSLDNEVYPNWEIRFDNLGDYVDRLIPSKNNKSTFLIDFSASSEEEVKLADSGGVNILEMRAVLHDLKFKNFLIYRPEESALRKGDESPLQPLGIRGEGLFKLLEVFKKEEQNENGQQPFTQLVELLRVIDWFEDLDIQKSEFGQRALKITDKYLDELTEYISQHSANEGFLFLLFYFSLFLSKHTPNFFAIDNIDTSLNPKLCRTLTTMLAKLAVENDKQVILTTHNPAILDGLDLKDDEQRLFVVSRNKLGHTKIDRFEKKPSMNGSESVKLSEAFMRGYIGGLPKGF